MSSAISDKITDYIKESEKDLISCNKDLSNLLDSRAQITSLCNSISLYLKNVVNGISTIEKLEDQANILLNSISELLQFSEKYPQEINNSFRILQAQKNAQESSVQGLSSLLVEIKEIESQQKKIMEELEIGNSSQTKVKKTRRKPGQRPESVKSKRSSLPNVKEDDGEIALEDI